MNVSLAWLRELAPRIEADRHTLAERLALLGAPVEGFEDLAAGLSDIVVARVIEAGPHPNADRLSLCRVDIGGGDVLDVVCGAPNVRSGGFYPFVRVGAHLPDGPRIRKAKIRGEVSNGMLCSPKELRLGTDHMGILELRGDYTPGAPFAEAFGLADVRLDVEVTANRGDLLSHLGVAREVAPEGVAGIALPAVPGAVDAPFELASDPSRVTLDGVEVRIAEPELCRRFLGALVRGVSVGPSPDWLQARLRAVGSRPINNVVDATNYVLHELGQPTHAYDLAKLEGAQVVTRLAREGERVRTLDGVDRTLSAAMLVIADSHRTVDVAGIMGEESSSVTEDTEDIFLECAHFEPKQIRATRKALALDSDAGYRFERFVDPTGQERALRRCLEVILATAGGTLHPVVADVNPRPWEPPVVPLRLARIERVLGIPFERDRVRALLEPLGFRIVGGDDARLIVEVPGWRGADVTREVDLIEEVARRHGFENFPEEMGAFRPTTTVDHPLFQLEDALRARLVAWGLFEAQTPAFAPASEGEVRLKNPLSREEPVLRATVLPSLVRRVEHNLARGVRDVRLFELATVFRAGAPAEPPLEDPCLAAVLTGRREPAHFEDRERPLDLWDLKGLLSSTLELARPGAELRPGAPAESGISPGEGWTIVDSTGDPVGWAGRIEADRVDTPPWAGAVLGLEVTLPHDPAPGSDPTYRPLPAFPGMERDVALLIPDSVPVAEVAAVARAAGGALLVDIEIFDVFTGEGVPAGQRSVGHRFRFRSAERTLTEKQVERTTRTIVDRLREELGVDVRG